MSDARDVGLMSCRSGMVDVPSSESFHQNLGQADAAAILSSGPGTVEMRADDGLFLVESGDGIACMSSGCEAADGAR